MATFPKNLINFCISLLVVLLPTSVLSLYLSVHPAVFIIFFLFFLWILYCLKEGRIPKIEDSFTLLLLFVLILLISFLSLIFAPPFPSYAYHLGISGLESPETVRYYGFFSLLKSLIFAFLITILISEKGFFLKILKLHIISAFIFSLFGIGVFLNYIFGGDFNFGLRTGWLAPRIESVSIEPQAFANYLLCVIPFLLMGLISKERFLFSKKTLFFYFLVIFIAFILTFSTGGYVAFLLMLFLFYFFIIFTSLGNFVEKEKIAIISLILIIGVVIFAIVGANVLKGVFGKFHPESLGFEFFGDRSPYWKKAFLMMKDRPLLGVGPESYGYFFQKYNNNIPPSQMGLPVLPPPQNLFLGMGANIGVFGGIFYFLIFLYLFFKLIRGSQSKDPFVAIFSFSLFLVLFCLFVQNMAFWTPYAFFLWFFIGLSGAFYRNFITPKLYEKNWN